MTFCHDKAFKYHTSNKCLVGSRNAAPSHRNIRQSHMTHDRQHYRGQNSVIIKYLKHWKCSRASLKCIAAGPYFDAFKNNTKNIVPTEALIIELCIHQTIQIPELCWVPYQNNCGVNINATTFKKRHAFNLQWNGSGNQLCQKNHNRMLHNNVQIQALHTDACRLTAVNWTHETLHKCKNAGHTLWATEIHLCHLQHQRLPLEHVRMNAPSCSYFDEIAQCISYPAALWCWQMFRNDASEAYDIGHCHHLGQIVQCKLGNVLTILVHKTVQHLSKTLKT